MLVAFTKMLAVEEDGPIRMVETTELAGESNVGYMKIKVTKVEWIFPLSDWMNTVVIY